MSFQLQLLQEVTKENEDKNVLISPVGIYHLLSLVTNGANRTTFMELIKALQSKEIDDLNSINKNVGKQIGKLSTVEMANGVFSVFETEKEFVDATKKYSANIEVLKDADQVNGWCAKATHDKIKTIVDSINSDVLMVLINALYFKGEWKKEFDAGNTKKRNFKNLNKEDKEVDFMNNTEKYDYFANDDLQAISLDYKKDNLKALVILPKKGELKDFIKDLTEEKYKEIVDGLKNQKVILGLPKFGFEFETDLIPNLSNLGIKQAFTTSADFSVMKKENDLFVKNFFHKTFLNVDEKGTEAGAASAAVVSRSFDSSLPAMNVDHPFLFIIRSEKMPEGHDMLFAGKVEKI